MSDLQIGDPIRVTIAKYDPSRDTAPYPVTYTVPYAREMRVLEALDYIVEELGESLAFQWFCGVKKCGMCGLRVNGRPVLGCWEPVEPEMLIEPMPNFPVLRDLVVEREAYFANVQALQPRLERGQAYAGFPEDLSPSAMAGAATMMHCIECLLCVSVCPTYGPEFVGPAPLVQLAKFALDPRDSGPRAQLALAPGGIANCVSCYQCSQACPVGIPVLEEAIDGLRKQIVAEGLGDVAHHNRVYEELVLEQGVVNPSSVVLRSLGWRSIAEIPFALRLWLKGRLSPLKVLKGLLRRDRPRKPDDLATLARAVKDIDWEARQ